MTIHGTIDRTEMTDRGVRYIGRASGGDDVLVDANDADMAINIDGRVILASGNYRERDDNDRKYLICDKRDGACIDFKVYGDGRFALKYYREQA
ncbi:MAG TPA: hypothetical protein VMC61_00110 [Methanocella sp.]|nr:hypothetical protein [Methanocella sp.]